MQTNQQLKDRVQAQHRAARHLLAEKGSQQWSANDQLIFDSLLDDAERTEAAMSSETLQAHHSRRMSAMQHAGLETFIRKSAQQMSAADRQLIMNTMSTTTGSQGGFSVGTLVAQDFVNRLAGYGWMRQTSTRYVTTLGGPGNLVASDGTAEVGEQVAENVTATALDPSFSSVDMTTYRYSSKIFTVPYELLQDSAIDIVAFILLRARDRIGRLMNQRFTTGTGSSQATGLVTAASVGKVGTTGQTLTIIYDDIADLIESLDEGQLGQPDKEAGIPNTLAGFMMSQSMRKVVRKLKDTSGRPIWLPGYDDGVRPAQSAMLDDYPVFINNDMAAPAANAKTLAFGNLASYTIRDALDVRLLRFDDSAYAKLGQVGFVAFARAGGNLADAGAVKLYQHSAT